MLEDLDKLRLENINLRSEVECFRTDKSEILDMLKSVKHTNTKLNTKLEETVKKSAAEISDLHQRQTDIIEENTRNVKVIEDLKFQISRRDQELFDKQALIDQMKVKIGMANRKNYEDRNVEFLHELQCTKENAENIKTKYDQMKQNNTKLTSRVTYLLNKLNEQTAELKNEKRRHNLLTAEFNSLLQENSNLRKQTMSQFEISRSCNSPCSAGGKDRIIDAILATEQTKGPQRQYHYKTGDRTYSRQTTNEDMNRTPSRQTYTEVLSERTPSRQTSYATSREHSRRLKRSTSHECVKTKSKSSKQVQRTKSTKDVIEAFK